MHRCKMINPQNIHKQNINYISTWIIYYAWVIVFTTWWTASHETDAMFSIKVRTMLHSLNLLSSAFFVLIIKKDSFVRASRIGAVLLVLSSVLFLTVKMPQLQLAIIIIFAISLGLVNIGILIPFVFVLNNTEKFYAVVSTNLLISILVLLQEQDILNTANGMLPSLFMLVLGLLPILRFKNEDLKSSSDGENIYLPNAKKIFCLTITLNCLYAILCKSVGKTFIEIIDNQSGKNLEVLFYIGAIAGCFIYFVVYACLKRGNLATWNITFATFVIALLLYALVAGNEIMFKAIPVLIGIGSTMGMINMYYILGVIGKKYNSHKYVKLSIIIIGCAGGITGVILGDLVLKEASIVLTFSTVSAVIIAVLLMISPTLSRTYFNDDWADDSQKPEVDNEKRYLFEKYNLSNREIELCKLLIQGYTLRQAAAALHIAYSTANTYNTSLYRKLNINSKTELLLIFSELIPKSV